MSPKPIEVVILSGMSGSGKSSALNTLEDAGYFAIDNLPGPLFPALMEILRGDRRFAHLRKMALVMDAREKSFLQDFQKYFGITQLWIQSYFNRYSKTFFYIAHNICLSSLI